MGDKQRNINQFFGGKGSPKPKKGAEPKVTSFFKAKPEKNGAETKKRQREGDGAASTSKAVRDAHAFACSRVLTTLLPYAATTLQAIQ